MLLIAVTLFVCLQIFFKLLNRRSADSNAHLLPRWSSIFQCKYTHRAVFTLALTFMDEACHL